MTAELYCVIYQWPVHSQLWGRNSIYKLQVVCRLDGKNLRTRLVLERFNWILENLYYCLLPTQLPCRTCSYIGIQCHWCLIHTCNIHVFMHLNKYAYWDNNIVYRRYHAVDNRQSKNLNIVTPTLYLLFLFITQYKYTLLERSVFSLSYDTKLFWI